MNKVLLSHKYIEIVLDITSWGLTIDFNVGIDYKVYRPFGIQILCFFFTFGKDPLEEYNDQRHIR